MTPEEREKLLEEYTDDILEGCDWDVLHQLARERLLDYNSSLTDEELIAECRENAPYLLPDWKGSDELI